MDHCILADGPTKAVVPTPVITSTAQEYVSAGISVEGWKPVNRERIQTVELLLSDPSLRTRPACRVQSIRQFRNIPFAGNERRKGWFCVR